MMAFDTNTGDDLRAEINVTPLVDVMLVLLVVFMVVTPLLRRQVPVELPLARQSEETRRADQLTLTAAADGRLLLDGNPVEAGALGEHLGRLWAEGRERTIFLSADRSLRYDVVVDLMDACRAAGVERIGIITRRLEVPKT